MRTFFVVVLMAFAAAAPAAAGEVAVTGCIEPGVEAGCIVIRTEQGVYNVTRAKPQPLVGQFGSVTGTPSAGIDFCQQGIILDPARFTVDAAKDCRVSK